MIHFYEVVMDNNKVKIAISLAASLVLINSSHARSADTYIQFALDSSLQNHQVQIDNVAFKDEPNHYGDYVRCNGMVNGPVTLPAIVSGMDILGVRCNNITPPRFNSAYMMTIDAYIDVSINGQKLRIDNRYNFDPCDARSFGLYRNIYILYLDKLGKLAYRSL